MLKHIALTNFQVFRERTVIPLADISLLVGPNSAGKSAVIDALQFVDLIVAAGEEEYRKMRSARERWRRKMTTHSAPMTVELGIRIDSVESYTLMPQDNIYHEISHRLSTQMEEDADGPAFKLDDKWEGEATLTIEIDQYGVESMTIVTDGERALRFTQPDDTGTLELYSAAMPHFLESVCELYGYDSKHAAAFKCKARFHGGQFHHDFAWDIGDGDFNYERILVLIANGILTSLKKNIGAPRTVAGDRGLIESYPEIFLTHGFFNEVKPNLWIGPNSSGSPKSKRKSDPALQELCHSALRESARLASKPVGMDVFDDEEIYSFQKHRLKAAPYDTAYLDRDRDLAFRQKNAPIHEFVNRHLRDSLFIDRGYQIAYEMCPVLPSIEATHEFPENRYWRNSSGEPGTKSGRGPFVYGAVVNAHLIDQQGARHAFSDVGTGISCVIPVLAAIHGPQSFIQQPELHLHPALQSALGDVLTDRLATGPCQHFIETHSEHLLLRLLRRVRETDAGKHPAASPLALTPQQLSILYFDPQSDGSTQVRQIRVSRDGDFIDRWPRGFFEERRRELFDE